MTRSLQFVLAALAGLSLCLSSSETPLLAQDPDYVLRASGGVGVVDQGFAVVVTLTVNGADVEEFSFTLCDDELTGVSITDVQLGADLAAVELKSASFTEEDGGWSAAVVMDADVNVLPSGATHELFVVDYELLDTGTSTLSFCDGAIANLVNGSTPALESGSIEIVPFLFLRGDANGDGVVEPLRDGYHIVLSGFLDPDGISCAISADANGNGVRNGLTDGLYMFSWGFNGGPAPPAPGPFECGGPAAGDTLGCEFAGTPCDGVLDPEPDEQYQFSIGSAIVAVQRAVTVPITLDQIEGEYLIGFQFSVCHDTGMLSLSEGSVSVGIALSELNDGAGPHRVFIQYLDEGWTAGVMIDILGFSGDVLKHGEGLTLFDVSYQALSTAGSADLEFCALSDPELAPRVMWTMDYTAAPAIEDGTIEIVEEGEFARGDVDGNGQVSALQDGMFLLKYGFINGAAPPCRDAADVDDNGHISPISDALALLGWGFLGGTDPPAPGPDACGLDPTEDDESCLASAEACQ